MEKEIIQKARQANLVDYLLLKGENIKKVGRYWIHKQHDSLVFKDNMFYWNSKEQKGNSIDFLMLFYNYEFQQAIEELTKIDLKEIVKDEPKDFIVNYSKDVKRVIAYMTKKRFIDYEIVKELLQRKLIAQDERGNIIFKIYDENNILIGAELCGTGDQRFKGVAEGTKYGYGFNFNTKDTVKYIFFFESPIDLISFYELKKDKIKNSILVSLAGLKENIVFNMLEINKTIPSNAFLCVDNDNAGKQFINTIQSKIKGIKSYLLSPYKDWNECLIKNKTR